MNQASLHFLYFSTNKFPPGIANEDIFIKVQNVINAHKEALKTIKNDNKKR